jgi:tetratricopeptide (TPR) repeat protein
MTIWFLDVLGSAACQRQQWAEAKALLTEGYTTAANLGNLWALSLTLSHLGLMALETGNYDEAAQFYRECLTTARKINHTMWIERALSGLYELAMVRSELSQAKTLAREALQSSRDTTRSSAILNAVTSLGRVATATGDYQEARQYLREALSMTSGVDLDFVPYPLMISAELFLRTGIQAPAVTILSFLNRQPMVSLLGNMGRVHFQSLLAELQTGLPASAFATAWEEGQP